MRASLKDARSFKQILIPFLLKLEGLTTSIHHEAGSKECNELIDVLDSFGTKPKPALSYLHQSVQQLREKLLMMTAKGLLQDLEQPRAKEVLLMFKRLFYELITGLKAFRNNDLTKWLTYEVFRKYDELFRFICAKNKIEANLQDPRCVEKAVTLLLEDT